MLYIQRGSSLPVIYTLIKERRLRFTGKTFAFVDRLDSDTVLGVDDMKTAMNNEQSKRIEGVRSC